MPGAFTQFKCAERLSWGGMDVCAIFASRLTTQRLFWAGDTNVMHETFGTSSYQLVYSSQLKSRTHGFIKPPVQGKTITPSSIVPGKYSSNVIDDLIAP